MISELGHNWVSTGDNARGFEILKKSKMADFWTIFVQNRTPYGYIMVMLSGAQQHMDAKNSAGCSERSTMDCWKHISSKCTNPPGPVLATAGYIPAYTEYISIYICCFNISG